MRCQPHSGWIYVQRTRVKKPHFLPYSLSILPVNYSIPSDDGYSGFAIIATSHVSLHAWAPYGMVNIDIFSCEAFEVTEVVAFACRMFQTKDVEVHAVERATRSPRISARRPMQPVERNMKLVAGLAFLLN